MSNSTHADVSGNQSEQQHQQQQSQQQQQQQQQQQFVCVKRPDASLTVVFEHMYLNERLVDVTLSCNNGQLQAHKLVLAACSPYFSCLFDKLANPFHYPVVVIKDMQIEDLRLLVEFMYRGQLTVNHEKLTDLAKCAEYLQITGFSSLDALITSPVDKNDSDHVTTINVEGPKIPPPLSSSHRMLKRTKRSTSSSINHQVILSRTYQRSIEQSEEYDHRPSPEKLLEQSMLTTNDVLDGSNQFANTAYAIASTNNHPTSTKNLIASNSHHLHQTAQHHSNHLHQNSVSSLQHIHHHLGIDNHHNSNNHHHNNHNLSNQLQVLSHSLAANRASMSAHNGGASSNGQSNNHLSATHNSSNSTSSLARGRVHPCNICWKTFREKANLKRHLQVHSIDRVLYTCPDCNKTFSWKDNYIRHTKTSHHMNNVTRQQGA